MTERNALEGEMFYVPSTNRVLARGLVGDKGGLCEVHAKTPGERGQWICVSCCEAFANNFEANQHARKRPKKTALVGPSTGRNGYTDTAPAHVFAWRNFKTERVEVP